MKEGSAVNSPRSYTRTPTHTNSSSGTSGIYNNNNDTSDDTAASARQAFASLLQRDSSSTYSSVDIREHFQSRIKDKRLQLSNPDRPRPKADKGTNAQRKLARRDKRARKQMSGGAGSSNNSVNGHGGSKGKAKAEASQGQASEDTSNKLLSRRKRKHRGLEGLDEEMSYEALLPLGSLWNSYIQQYLGLVKVQPVRTDPSTPSASSSRLVPNLQVLKASPLAGSGAGSPSISWTFTSDAALSNVLSQTCKADLLGAPLEVIRAGNPALVGTKGMVAKETERCFLLALQRLRPPCDHGEAKSGQTRDGGQPHTSQVAPCSRFFKVVPKHNVTFLLRVPLPPLPSKRADGAFASESAGGILEVPLQGNQMSSTMVTRASKKWKQRKTMDY